MRKVECEYYENGTIQYAGRTYLSTDEVKNTVDAFLKLHSIERRLFGEVHDILNTLLHAGYTIEEIASSTIYSIAELKAYL